MDYDILLSTAKTILNKEENTIEQKLQELCNLLQQSVEHYDWVGFYFANQEEKTLHLGPYAGLPTDHTVIPFGKGICGQVAVSNNTFLVEDVTVQGNYISCNINVKAEIVVPLFVSGQNIGQIDIDSNTLNAFTTEDRLFLEKLNEEISWLF